MTEKENVIKNIISLLNECEDIELLNLIQSLLVTAEVSV